jgi:hypothetical protein
VKPDDEARYVTTRSIPLGWPLAFVIVDGVGHAEDLTQPTAIGKPLAEGR